MVIAVALWMVAMAAGLCWPRWVVGATTAATLLSAVIALPSCLSRPSGWLLLAAFGMTPSLLAAQRRRLAKRLRRLQRQQAVKLSRLQERERAVVHLHAGNQRLESQISQITELYHVTRDTARALRTEELFTFSLGIIPKLLQVSGFRLIDGSVSPDEPLVLRARRVPDGRLCQDPPSAILPVERAILSQTSRSGLAAVAQPGHFTCEWPREVGRLAWAPLWAEEQPIGALIADELPTEQVGTLSVVANQLSLQLSRIRLYQAVESMAVTDTLTGLSVRRYFLELAAEELLRSARHTLACTLLLTDLDLFKQKNDTYGHLVGDVVLRDVAQLMKRHLRGIDLIARFGGEEFLLLLVETGPEAGLVIAERLRQLVELHPIRAYDETLSQTVSIGVASFPDDGRDVAELIERADEALYAAKHAGRNRVMRWSPALEAQGAGALRHHPEAVPEHVESTDA